MGKAYEDFPDTFGPWTPGGTNGKDPPKGKKDPTPTTPAIIDPVSSEFWDTTTEGYAQIVAAPPWSRCKLGKYDLPGIVTVDCPMPKLEADKKKVKGQGAATVNITGWQASDLTIECLLWTPTHLAKWRQLETEIAPEKQKTPPAYDILSPVVNPRVTSVLVLRISALKPGRVKGSKIGVLDCLQNVPKPKPTGGKPGKSLAVNSAVQASVYAAYALYRTRILIGEVAAIRWSDFVFNQSRHFGTTVEQKEALNVPPPPFYIPPPSPDKAKKALA